jgi:hypothetical protein
MPNHVTTICTVTGSAADVARFRAAHIVPRKDGKGDHFDFDTIIPTPACIEATGEPHTCGDLEVEMAAIALLLGERNEFKPFPYAYPSHKERYGTTTKQVLASLTKNGGDAIEFGKRALRAVVETGHAGWYEWNIDKWGTKWGSYSYGPRPSAPDRLVFKFETAWSFPEPIFRKLAEMYPELVFAVRSFDEGWNFACVGEFNGANDYAKVEATRELYGEVYGAERLAQHDQDAAEDEAS